MIKVSKGCLQEEELVAVRKVFDGGYFGLGSQVLEFEDALKNYLEAPRVLCVNTGTSALHIALDALGIGAGDEVIVPSLTFVASFQAIYATGATPVPCDVEPNTFSIDLSDVERRLTTRTKAIMPVHYAGNACDMDGLLVLKQRYGIRIIEDAAHAFGTTYKKRKIGSFGDITCFSFDSIKNITCGEGGAVVCRDEELADLIVRKRLLGMNRTPRQVSGWKEQTQPLEVTTRGFRYHMSNINAAIGLVQLGKAEQFVARRREICRRYDQAFANIPGLASLSIDYDQAAPHIHVVRVNDGRRDALKEFLRTRDIETAINYVPNHLHPYFRHPGLSLPVTEQVYREMLTLPLHCGLSDADVEFVIGSVHDFFTSTEV